MAQLSPLLQAALVERSRKDDGLTDGLPGVGAPAIRGDAEPVSAWQCSNCGDLHLRRSDAEVCCQPIHHEEAPQVCPICDAVHKDSYNAADCCLWKSLDAPTRRRIADQVEAGSTWTEAISAVTAH